jgi:predicted NBD/HSP70 family sugar kinase/predicted transcriptional regulator
MVDQRLERLGRISAVDSGGTRHGSAEPAERHFHRGTNQSGMRDRNERLVLSLVRQHGSLAKTDIARMTGLSAQTVSVIMRELEEEGLLLRMEPVRGKVGQPSVPMALNPDGAYFLGLKIGRRSAELVLIDFLGNVRAMLRNSYRYPAPRETVDFVSNGIKRIRANLDSRQDGRIAGLGIAMPFELWNWADTAGAPSDIMAQWRNRDIRADVQAQCKFPVYLQNDATAACGAELVFGRTGRLHDFIYFYIGAFAGGGVVLNGGLYAGATGNAGALGSMPVPGADGRPAQLIDVASLAILERALNARNIDATYLWTDPENWLGEEPEFDAWFDAAGRALAYAIVSASAVIDFEAAIIDGWMPATARQRLVKSVQRALAEIDVEGLKVPAVFEGTVGIHARAIGGASLPLSERFLIGSTERSKGS